MGDMHTRARVVDQRPRGRSHTTHTRTLDST